MKVEGTFQSTFEYDDNKKSGATLHTNSAVTSDESSDPSILANVSHASTFASNDTFATLEDYPLFNRFISSFGQCVDNMNGVCFAEESPVDKPSLLYRAKSSKEKPGEKLLTRDRNRESYLNRFTLKQRLEAQKETAGDQEPTEEVSKVGTFDRIRGLVQRKPLKREAREKVNSRRGPPKTRQHRRRRRDKGSIGSSVASSHQMMSVPETSQTNVTAETQKEETSASNALQVSEPAINDLRLVVSRSDDEEEELFRASAMARSPDMHNATTPKASLMTKTPMSSSPAWPGAQIQSSEDLRKEALSRSHWASPQDSPSKYSECSLSTSNTKPSVEWSLTTTGKSSLATGQEPPSESRSRNSKPVSPINSTIVEPPSASEVSPTSTLSRKTPTRFPSRRARNRERARASGMAN